MSERRDEEAAWREERDRLADTAMTARRESLAADRRDRLAWQIRLARSFPHMEDEHPIESRYDRERFAEEYRRDS